MLALPYAMAVGVAVLLLVLGFVAGFWLRPRPMVLAEAPQFNPPAVLPDTPLQARARVLTADAEATCAPGTSGEFKRHQVYSRLLKEFPGEPRRAAAMAIERAVSEGL